MRTWISVALVSAGFGIASLASAADPRELQPEAKVYLGFHFDGREAASTNEFVYGLRIDHDRRYTPRSVPALAKLEFSSRQGFNQLQVNGLPIAYRSYQLNQDGTASTEYSWVDWGLVAVAAVGIGFVLVDVADADESPSPKRSSTQVSTLPPEQQNALAGLVPGGLPENATLQDVIDQVGSAGPVEQIVGTIVPGLMGQERSGAQITRNTPQYQRWLDGGTGHMGDLFAPQ